MGHDLDFYRRIPNLPTPYGQALTMLLLTEVLLEGEGGA
jgi:unsaturated rhamnogalacturonyl hydrolase